MRPRSAGSSNWSGIHEDRDRDETAFRPAARSTSERCPSCRAPMVGTRPTERRRAPSSKAVENSAALRTTRTAMPPTRMRPLRGTTLPEATSASFVFNRRRCGTLPLDEAASERDAGVVAGVLFSGRGLHGDGRVSQCRPSPLAR